MTGPATTVHTSLAGRWDADPTVCEARFHVRDKLIASAHGTLPVGVGVVVIDPTGNVTSARLELLVDGIATGNSHRDKDLRKPRLLDAAAHPRVTVDLKGATRSAFGWTAAALLTARGATAPIDLAVEVVDVSNEEVRVRAVGRLDRAPLGIKAPTFVIGRFIDIEVDLVLRRTTTVL